MVARVLEFRANVARDLQKFGRLNRSVKRASAVTDVAAPDGTVVIPGARKIPSGRCLVPSPLMNAADSTEAKASEKSEISSEPMLKAESSI